MIYALKALFEFPELHLSALRFAPHLVPHFVRFPAIHTA
jgi:hypothetical protein